MARVMEITTPLGADVLLFHTMHGREDLSRVAEYRLDLLSLKDDVNIDQILGKTVTVKLALDDGGTRYFNGYVTRFSQGSKYGKYRRYYATVHPWMWFMSRTADCRIFQEKTVPEIIKAVFADHPTSSFKDECTGSYRKWTYCVQYRETDLNFVCRLMEQEGMYFYVTHADGKHTLVLADSYSGHTAFQKKPVPFIAPEDISRGDIENITAWNLTREIQPGVYVHDDYDFERPSVDLQTKKVVSQGNPPSPYEMYDYPGEYLQKKEGEALVAARMDEYAAQFETAQGVTNAKNMKVGSLFTLERAPRADQNREHLVVSATYDLEYNDYESMLDRSGTEYRCTFVAMSSKQQFRPQRLTPKPFVQGPQTAVVVGPAGDEIYTDKYGRVKVLFHWDRVGEKAKDENSSCWVRVSHPWAGKAWGVIAIPRIGQEVIVDFLEGDPDEPIITGRVYNAEQMPPYALPANKTQTGIKTRSSKEGTPDNFNEIRFEDLKGSEQLFIHAEKNQDIEVENDETHWVGHDRKKTIDNDETTHVKHDRTETVDNNETITIHANRTETVDKDETITISGSRTESVSQNETISIGKNRIENVRDNESVSVGKDQSLTVNGNRTVSVSKDESISVTGKRIDSVAKEESVEVGKSRDVTIGQDDMLQVAKKLMVDAGDEITIKTGSASIVMKKDGTITIKGKDITLQGSGKINAKASSDVVIKGNKVTQN
jgi:type VI secretion system secreted protein VgrG